MPDRLEAPRDKREEREKQRQEHIAHLRKCLDEWSDEIPEQIVHNEGNYKVRAAWFSIVTGRVEFALEFLQDDAFADEINAQLDPVIALARHHTESPEGQNRNTKEQVDTCNEILRKVIDRLTSL